AFAPDAPALALASHLAHRDLELNLDAFFPAHHCVDDAGLVSLLISVLQYILNRNLKFLPAGPLTKPLIFLTAVILITARFRGGIGLQMFGGSMVGGKGYIILLTAIAGFFAITARRVP